MTVEVEGGVVIIWFRLSSGPSKYRGQCRRETGSVAVCARTRTSSAITTREGGGGYCCC